MNAATHEVHIGYLGLGSNVGDRLARLRDAIEELQRHGVEVLACSSVYETEPVGLVLDQRDFLNACVKVRTELGPEQLLDTCKEVERVVGREASGVRHGPRVIDVDVLLLGGMTYHSADLGARLGPADRGTGLGPADRGAGLGPTARGTGLGPARGLEVPHPDIVQRRFVLVPLLELDPELALPDGTLLSDALAALGPGQQVNKVGPPLLGAR